jgi:hypothetical protein
MRQRFFQFNEHKAFQEMSQSDGISAESEATGTLHRKATANVGTRLLQGCETAIRDLEKAYMT